MKIIRSLWSRKAFILGGLIGSYWVYYSYNRFEFTIFVSYCALLVASFAALAALLSLKYTRDTVRPFLSFDGTINLSPTTFAFPITNTGSMPANDVIVRIDPFEVDEDIGLENVSKKFSNFFDDEGKNLEEALVLFPNQTWQSVFDVNFAKKSHKELWEKLLVDRNIKIRITISYNSFGRKHKTIQTLAFDILSLSKDRKQFHGLSINPQKWI